MKNLLHKLGGTPPSDNKLYEVEIRYKRPRLKQTVKLDSSEDAYKALLAVMADYCLDHKEFFWIFLVNPAGYIVGFREIGRGAIDLTVVNVPEIFQLALLANASGIILLHNHPSGSLEPSAQDIQITRNISEVAKLFAMKVWDHLVISSEGYYSFQDEGKL